MSVGSLLHTSTSPIAAAHISSIRGTGFSLGLFQRALCPLGPLMCPLAPPLDQHIFNSYLTYLSLKVSVVKVELALGGILTVVHMKQMFGTDSYFQDEGCGREILFVPFGL